jgi:hypothetical protein
LVGLNIKSNDEGKGLKSAYKSNPNDGQYKSALYTSPGNTKGNDHHLNQLTSPVSSQYTGTT